MKADDLESELEKTPFVPLRLHLVSGKTLTVHSPNAAWILQNTVMLLRGNKPGKYSGEGYDTVALANIERIEQLTAKHRNGSRRRPVINPLNSPSRWPVLP